MTTVTLPEAIAAIEAAMKAHDPTLLDGLAILTVDGRTVPIRQMTGDQLRAEVDAHRALLDVQQAVLDQTSRAHDEMAAFFGDDIDAALSLVQQSLADSGAPTIPHPSRPGTVAVDPDAVAAAWHDLDDLDRRRLRGRIDMQRRVGGYWEDLALAVARGISQRDTPHIDTSVLDDEDWIGLGLTLWDALDTGNRDRLAAMWQQALDETRGADR